MLLHPSSFLSQIHDDDPAHVIQAPPTPAKKPHPPRLVVYSHGVQYATPRPRVQPRVPKLSVPAQMFLSEIQKLQTLPFNHRLRLARKLLPYGDGFGVGELDRTGGVSNIALNSASYLSAVLAGNLFQKRLGIQSTVIQPSKPTLHVVTQQGIIRTFGLANSTVDGKQPKNEEWIGSNVEKPPQYLLHLLYSQLAVFVDECLKMDPRLLNHCDRMTHQTPLSLAVRHGYNDVVARLLSEPGIDVNKPTRQRIGEETPLLTAIRTENMEAVKMLLVRDDIDVNFKNFKGETAIQGLKTVLDKRQKSCHEAAAVLEFLLKQNEKPLRFLDDFGEEVTRDQAFEKACEHVYDDPPVHDVDFDQEDLEMLWIADPEGLLNAIHRNTLPAIQRILMPILQYLRFDVHCPYCGDPLGFEKSNQKEHFMCKCPACSLVFVSARGPNAHISDKAIDLAQTIYKEEERRFDEVDKLFQAALKKNTRAIRWSGKMSEMSIRRLKDALNNNNRITLKDLMTFADFDVNAFISGDKTLLSYAIEHDCDVDLVTELLAHPEICVNYGGFKYRYGCEGDFYWMHYSSPFQEAQRRHPEIWIPLLCKHPEIANLKLREFFEEPERVLLPELLHHPAFDPNRIFGRRNRTSVSSTFWEGIQRLLTHPRAEPFLFRAALTTCVRGEFGLDEYRRVEADDLESVLDFCYQRIKHQKKRHVRWARFQIMLCYVHMGNLEQAMNFYDLKTIKMVPKLKNYQMALSAFIESRLRRRDMPPTEELISFVFTKLRIGSDDVLKVWEGVVRFGDLNLVQFTANFLTDPNLCYFYPFVHEMEIDSDQCQEEILCKIDAERMVHENRSCYLCNQEQWPMNKKIVENYPIYVQSCLKFLIDRKLYNAHTLYWTFQRLLLLRNPLLQTAWLDVLASAPEFDINYVYDAETMGPEVSRGVCSKGSTALTVLARVSAYFCDVKEGRCNRTDVKWSPNGQFKRVLHYLLTRFPSLNIDWKDPAGKSAVDYCSSDLLKNWIAENTAACEWTRIVKFGWLGMPRDVVLRVHGLMGQRLTLEGIEATYQKEVAALGGEYRVPFNMEDLWRQAREFAEGGEALEEEEEEDLLAAVLVPPPRPLRPPSRPPSRPVLTQSSHETEEEEGEALEEEEWRRAALNEEGEVEEEEEEGEVVDEEEEEEEDEEEEDDLRPSPKPPASKTKTVSASKFVSGDSSTFFVPKTRQSKITNWFSLTTLRDDNDFNDVVTFTLGKSRKVDETKYKYMKITTWLKNSSNGVGTLWYV